MLIKCDNDAVVKVLSHGRARDLFLAACARNAWYIAADADVDVCYVHVMGKNNQVADLLSRWSNSSMDHSRLHEYVESPVWINVELQMLQVDYAI